MKRQLNKANRKDKAEVFSRKANQVIPWISNGEAAVLLRIYKQRKAGLPISGQDEWEAEKLIRDGVLAKDFLLTPEDHTGQISKVGNDQHNTPDAL